jgi:hypothetical protein
LNIHEATLLIKVRQEGKRKKDGKRAIKEVKEIFQWRLREALAPLSSL